MLSIQRETGIQRLQIALQGAVQGVGFRPFVYRLATDLGLRGWVQNSAQGVLVEVEGPRSQLESFLERLSSEKPQLAFFHQESATWLPAIGDSSFEIRPSASGAKTAVILPDLAICPDCLQEIFDPHNHRYHYPFTNCTNCGPRFSIIEALPYDRPNTTMKAFTMCDRCRAEYENPRDRRFHAQPNACPDCGPHLELWDARGQVITLGTAPLHKAAEAIRQGQIVAVKGLGGFHLVVDARSDVAVQRLRQVKHRAAKPFAVMYPTLEQVQAHCEVSELEAKLLRSPESPIVLLRRRNVTDQLFMPSAGVAPNNPYLGVMLPYTPLHHLLLAELGFPIVATSGNLSNEPICTDEQEAVQRLQGIADLFLIHNRPIFRPVDDSVVRVVLGEVSVLRRARGYAPLPISLSASTDKPLPPLLAVGGHLKNTIAIALAQQVFVSQHIGDLDTLPTLEAWQNAIQSFQKLYELQPVAVACDLHPDYHSTLLASQLSLPVIPVQHHYAHVLAAMAEHHLTGSALGIAWDGTGYGGDGTIWGGEFLRVSETGFTRVAHLRSFRLVGGDTAAKAPNRVAIGLLYELLGASLFHPSNLIPVQATSPSELAIFQTMLQRRYQTPLTSSAGRLFDAIASLLGLCQTIDFEGQAAMALEFAIAGHQTDLSYDFRLISPADQEITTPIVVDWEPMVMAILAEIQAGVDIAAIAAKFHNTLVEAIVAVAHQVGETNIVLTGGCFQNQYLLKRAIQRLRAEHFCPYWHQQVPCNDGGLALGQIIAAYRQLQIQN